MPEARSHPGALAGILRGATASAGTPRSTSGRRPPQRFAAAKKEAEKELRRSLRGLYRSSLRGAFGAAGNEGEPQ